MYYQLSLFRYEEQIVVIVVSLVLSWFEGRRLETRSKPTPIRDASDFILLFFFSGFVQAENKTNG